MHIKINLQIFLIIIIFILTHQIEIYACVMLFAFIHELGHLLAGILLKLKPKTLSLMPFGISIVFEDYGYKKLHEIKKIIISLAGPITNFLIILITCFLQINIHVKETIIYSNMLIAIFNLIPIYPLDGGRILKYIIRFKLGKKQTDAIINKISNIIIILITLVSSIAILYLKNVAILFILAYLWFIVIIENKRYNEKKIIYEILQKRNKCIDI